MNKYILQAISVTLLVLLTSCAATYHSINPKNIKYSTTDSHDGIEFSYRYDVLSERGNKRYSKKERKKNLKVVAIRIKNNTDSIIGRDIEFYSGQNKVFPLTPLQIKKHLRQNVPSYLPYALLTFLNIIIYDGRDEKVYPIGLALGPGLTILNVSTAATANKRMFQELTAFDILNKSIQKGETVYGIIGFGEVGYNPLTFKLKK